MGLIRKDDSESMKILELIEEALCYFDEKVSEWEFRKENHVFNNKDDIIDAIKSDIRDLQRLPEKIENEN